MGLRPPDYARSWKNNQARQKPELILPRCTEETKVLRNSRVVIKSNKEGIKTLQRGGLGKRQEIRTGRGQKETDETRVKAQGKKLPKREWKKLSLHAGSEYLSAPKKEKVLAAHRRTCRERESRQGLTWERGRKKKASASSSWIEKGIIEGGKKQTAATPGGNV